MNDQNLIVNIYAVQMIAETCTCKTPLKIAFFVQNNAKYWNHNFMNNLIYKCLYVNKIHFIKRETDSAYCAVSDDACVGQK